MLLDVHSRPKGHTEGLDRAIEIFVIDREFIVPDAGGRIRHLVANQENTVVSRIGFELVHSGAEYLSRPRWRAAFALC